MHRPPVERPRRRLLDHAAGIHHEYPAGEFGDHAEVVRYQNDRHIQFRLQVAQQIENLRLDGDVERRRRFIGNEQPRPAGDGDCDHHALPHAAGKLVRIRIYPLRRVGNSDHVQQCDRPFARRATAEALMQDQGFADLVGDRQHRVQRRHRVLEDHRDLAAADAPHRPLRELTQILAVVENFPGGHAGRTAGV